MSEGVKATIAASAILILIISFVTAMVLMFKYVNDEHEKAQRNQDKCVAAGGLWIQNRNTEGYCYNK